MGRPRIEHGRQSWKLGRCACGRCRAASSRYSKAWRAAVVVRRGGEPASRVDPGRARRHVEALREAGWRVGEIAAAAGVHRITVQKLIHRGYRRLSRISERALLAVGP